MSAMVDAGRAERLRRHHARQYLLGRVGLYALAVLAAVVCAGPFLWSTVTATKLNADLYNPSNNPFVYNQPPTFDHVRFLFTETTFPTFAWNTLWVGLLVVLVTLVLCLPAAYSIARLDLRWSGAMGIAIFFVYLIPPSLLFLSLTRLVVWLGLQDSTWSLVLIYPTITHPRVDLAVDRLPQGAPEGRRGAGNDRRLQPGRRVRADRGAAAVPGHRRSRGVRVHPDRERVHLRARVRVAHPGEGGEHGGADRADPRRRLPLAVLQAANIVIAVPIAFVFNLFLARFHLRVHDLGGEGSTAGICIDCSVS